MTTMVGDLLSHCSRVCVNSSHDFKETMEDSKKVSGDTTDDTELLIMPPVLNANTTPRVKLVGFPQFEEL